MIFIQFEAIDESQQNQPLSISDDERTNDEADFIDDREQPKEDVSFFRKLDPENIEYYNKFPNQTRDPRTAVYQAYEMFLVLRTHNLNCMILKIGKIFKFEGFEKSVKKFRNTLKNIAATTLFLT